MGMYVDIFVVYRATCTYLVVQGERNIAKPVVLDVIPPHIQPFSCPADIAPHSGSLWWCCKEIINYVYMCVDALPHLVFSVFILILRGLFVNISQCSPGGPRPAPLKARTSMR